MSRLTLLLALPLVAGLAPLTSAAEPVDVELSTANIGNPRLTIPECADVPNGISAYIWFNALDSNNEYGSVEVSADSRICPRVIVQVAYLDSFARRLPEASRNIEVTPGNDGESLHLFAVGPIGSYVDQYTYARTFCLARYVAVTVKWTSTDGLQSLSTGRYVLDRGAAWGDRVTCPAY